MAATSTDTAAPSLAERLGYRADDKVVIINCDDLGMSSAANRAVYRALREGAATSTTLMVPCPWSRQALEDYRGEDAGVHLTLNSEYAGYRWRPLTPAPSLRDDDGCFPRTIHEVWEKADLGEVRAELEAQIAAARSWGLNITHLDSHMGTLQIDERYFEIYLDLAQAHDLPLRLSGRSTEELLGFEFRDRTEAAGVVAPDHLVYGMGEVVLPAIENLPIGVTEIYFHPAEDTEELRSLADDAEIRVNDLAWLTTDGRIDRMLEAQGAHRISYRPLLELQRAAR